MAASSSALTICYYCTGCWWYLELFKEVEKTKHQNWNQRISNPHIPQTKTWCFRNRRIVFCKGISAKFGRKYLRCVASQIHLALEMVRINHQTCFLLCICILLTEHLCQVMTTAFRNKIEMLWSSCFPVFATRGWREQSRLAQWQSPKHELTPFQTLNVINVITIP